MYMITEEAPSFHPHYSQRILYVGHDFALLKFLRETLAECSIVRAPTGSVARLLIDKLNYVLLLFDEVLPDTTGLVLACFTRELTHREHTPIIVVKRSDEFASLARAIMRLLVVQK